MDPDHCCDRDHLSRQLLPRFLAIFWLATGRTSLIATTTMFPVTWAVDPTRNDLSLAIVGDFQRWGPPARLVYVCPNHICPAHDSVHPDRLPAISSSFVRIHRVVQTRVRVYLPS